MTKEEQKRDKYYLKKYNKNLAWYNRTLAEQNYACGVCERPAKEFTRSLAIDHAHDYRYVKIYTTKWSRGWLSEAFYLGQRFHSSQPHSKKSETARLVRNLLKSASVRGILCWKCNIGLQKWKDNPSLMEKAAKYLRRHQGK